jgi:hypothetical protein
MSLGYPAVMYELRQTAGFEPQLIVSHESQQETSTRTSSGGVPSLREVPGLPLRVGRHLTAWVVWHTARVTLLSDVSSHQLNGSADHSL